jgi:elongation factor Ts
MTQIDARLVKALREKTGAGVIACKHALEETHGDFEAAADRLRAAELLKAAQRADRVAVEGLVGVVVEGRWARSRSSTPKRISWRAPGLPV